MKIHKSKSIKEAVDIFQEFLECDLYSRFRPAQTLPIGKKGKDETWYRDVEDVFKSERDFLKYLEAHFDILRKEIKKLINEMPKDIGKRFDEEVISVKELTSSIEGK